MLPPPKKILQISLCGAEWPVPVTRALLQVYIQQLEFKFPFSLNCHKFIVFMTLPEATCFKLFISSVSSAEHANVGKGSVILMVVLVLNDDFDEDDE